MIYRVISRFIDAENKELYEVGDEFPHFGIQASKDRIDELSGPNNRVGVPLIEECVSEATEDVLMPKTNASSSSNSEAKEKPKKRQGRHARTDS